MHPLIELLFNPMAGEAFNMCAVMVWLALAGLVILAVIERAGR